MRAGRLISPRSWPIVLKMSVSLLLAALLPLLLGVWLTSSRAQRSLRDASRSNLQLLAAVTAARLDQLIADTARTVELLRKEEDLISMCAGDGASRAALAPRVTRRLGQVVESNPDFALMIITDSAGVGLAGTDAATVGMDFNFREYVARARAGELYASEMLVGKTSARPGVFFAAPVRDIRSGDAAGPIVGVVVLKLQGERIWAMTDAVRIGERGYATVSDRNGIVIAHPNKERLFSSIGALSPEKVREIDPETTWGRETIPSLGLDELMASVSGGAGTGSAEFGAPTGRNSAREEWIVGFAKMQHRGWAVSVVEPRTQFAQATTRLLRQQWAIVVGVAALAGALALWRARSIVRPVLALTDAAKKMSAGDFDARAEQNSEDEIGRLASVFNAMGPRLKDHVFLKQSLEVAVEVQQSLLPQGDPLTPRLDIAGRTRYCDATGGDYYDFIDVSRVSETTTLIALGDVMGHGVGAALLMASARGALRSHAAEQGRLAALLTRVNHVLAGDEGHHRFMTMVLTVVDPVRGTVRWASAGHDPTMILHVERDEFEELTGGDVPLGIMPGVEYQEFQRDGLRPGDILLVGTDGIWEMPNEQGAHYGKSKLRRLLREHRNGSAAQIAAALEADLASFRGAVAPKDDVTFVVVRILTVEEDAQRAGRGAPATAAAPR